MSNLPQASVPDVKLHVYNKATLQNMTGYEFLSYLDSLNFNDPLVQEIERRLRQGNCGINEFTRGYDNA